jgi:hypothetical protein
VTQGRQPLTFGAAWGRSVSKPVNDSFAIGDRLAWRQNEDRFRLSRSRKSCLAAVSDGAGGAGLFCGAWAQTLVVRLPNRPLASFDGLNAWLDGFCSTFRRDHAERLLGQPVKHGKFVREGSLATLSAVWLAQGRQHVALHWLGCGDSPILIFDRTGRRPTLIGGFPARLSALGKSPALLNWKDLPRRERVSIGGLRLPPQATIVVASDGIGHYLLLRYLCEQGWGLDGLNRSALLAHLASETSPLGPLARAHRNHPRQRFANILRDLGAALSSDRAFARFVKARHREGLMANDDATLLLIDIDVRLLGSRSVRGPRRPVRRAPIG